MKNLLFASLSLFLPLAASVAETADWTVLFDGASADQWRGYQSDRFPDGGWKVEDGILTSIGDGDRIDIITRERYTNFELELEWSVEQGANSGIFYRANEEPPAIWHHAPEIQILDDTGLNADPGSVQTAGALYDLLPANDRKELRPTGEFNSTRLIVQGSQVEHWLNDEKILSYDLDDPDLREKISKSKFAVFDKFGRVENGHIGLQHHGDSVRFRNIRIRELAAPANN